MVTMRPLNLEDPVEVRAWADLTSSVFLQDRSADAELERRRAQLRGERTTVAPIDDRLVATFRSFDTTVSVPGGALVPANALTGVVVRPTHKRRGLLRQWITSDLARARDCGSVFSLLYASETGIYSRFGFGVATGTACWRLDRRRTRFRHRPVGSCLMVELHELDPLVEAIYQAAQARNVGSIARRQADWDRAFYQVGRGQSPQGLRFVLHRNDEGVPDGYLTYRVTDRWDDGIEQAELIVQDLVAATTEAEQALWGYCANVDFITEIRCSSSSPDLPLPYWLTDPRAADVGGVMDALWVRIHDVPAGLSARSYDAAVKLRFEITDPLGQCTGRYRLDVSDDRRGHCSGLDTSQEVDFTVTISALATLMFGCAYGVPSLEAMVNTGDLVAEPEVQGRINAAFGVRDRRLSLTRF